MESKSCCPKPDRRPQGLWSGLLYGLLPHTFCVAFIVFSVAGAAAAGAFFKKILFVPYFFEVLVGLSLILAAVSGLLYLKKKGELSRKGVYRHKGYLTILLGTTLFVNWLFFFVVFPWMANRQGAGPAGAETGEVKGESRASLEVQIPCSGHASLIIDEIKKDPGVREVSFQLPNRFLVTYDGQKTSLEKILTLQIFKSFPAKPIN